MKQYTLSKEEVQQVLDFYEEREAYSREHGFKNKRNFVVSPEEYKRNQCRSIAAEIAVAKCLGLEPQLKNACINGAPDITYNNLKIDVKYTGTQQLLCPCCNLKKDVVYVMVTGGKDQYQIQGFLTGEELKQIGNKTNFGKENLPYVYAAHKTQLKPLETLINVTNSEDFSEFFDF